MKQVEQEQDSFKLIRNEGVKKAKTFTTTQWRHKQLCFGGAKHTLAPFCQILVGLILHFTNIIPNIAGAIALCPQIGRASCRERVC